jgi:hypothetical protein
MLGALSGPRQWLQLLLPEQRRLQRLPPQRRVGSRSQLHNCLWLLAAELVDQVVAHSAILEGRNDINVCQTWDCVVLLGETLDVVPYGLALLLQAALEVLGVAGAHIGALEVAGLWCSSIDGPARLWWIQPSR